MKGGRLAVVVGTSVAAGTLVPDGDRVVLGVAGAEISVVDDGDVVVLDRHGRSRDLAAHRVPHEANLEALVMSGCDRVLALGSVGSLRGDWPVGTVTAPDDFFAPWSTPSLSEDALGHTVPGFDPSWRQSVIETWSSRTDTRIHDGGVYAQTRGPRFETPSEVRFLATVADVVGMTVASECILARELGLRYAAVCTVDNMANGLAGDPLTIEAFETGVAANRGRLVADLERVIDALAGR